MNCPRCSTPVPPPADLTQRTVPCPGCGTAVDLASEAGATTVRPPAPPPAPAGDDPWIGRPIAAGRYTIESLLGAGGMGRVYRARQTALGRAVAVKILSPELARDAGFRRRFEREAGTLAALEHPRIVTIHDVGVEGDVPYIVMALVVGPKGAPVSLRDLLDAGPVEEELALRIIQETCAALEYAHGKGVIHRDIKPGNILLDAEGHAKIADFGIARVAGASDAAHLTTTGAVLGTMRYMAPEQLADAARADARSDLYSLGVVFYEMLTGQSPVGRFELPSEVRAGLDHRLDGIVDRALRRAANQRYASAGEMARDLSRITTERDYGRLQGADGGASGATGASGAATAGGGGGRHPPTSAPAPAHAASAPVGAGTAPGAPPAPPSSSPPTAHRAPASNRRGLLGAALALAVIGGGLGVYFATRGPSSPRSTPVGQGPAAPAAPDPKAAPEPKAAPRPDPTPAPAPDPKPPPAPDPKPPPGPAPVAPGMETPPPPAAMDPVAPPVAPPKAPVAPPNTPVAPPKPPVAPPNLAKGAGGLPDTGAATPADRRLLEEARTRAIELLTHDEMDEETYGKLKAALPSSGSLFDRHAAQKALEAQLARWRAGRAAEVVANLPAAVVARAAQVLEVTPETVRAASIQVLSDTPLATWKIRDTQSVGNGFVLALYDTSAGAAADDDDAETRIAVAVLEDGAWKVFP